MSKWISVKDRLPEKELDYLVTDGNDQMVAAFIIKYRIWDFFRNTFWESEEVTHWMPLPEPPKE